MLLKGEKMSKSTGLYFAAKELLEQYSPESIRLFILQKHYRSPAEYMQEYLDEAERALYRIKNFLESTPSIENGVVNKNYVEKFQRFMDDDLNTPAAVSLIFDLIREGNQKLANGEIPTEEKSTLLLLLEVLGFNISNLSTKKPEVDLIKELMEVILDVRQRLRKNKHFQLADEIREKLEQLGFKIKDTKEGSVFEF